MKKVYLGFKFTEEEKERLKRISKDLLFVESKDKDINVILGNYPTQKIIELDNLEWFQSAAVGIDKYIKKGILPEKTVLTNAVNIHTLEVAEHTLSMLLMMIKNNYLYRDNQKEHLWKDEGMTKSYKGFVVTIVGLGNIGNTLAKMIKSLGMYVIGVKRKAIAAPEYIDELYTQENLNKALNKADAVISILPGNYNNQYLFDLDVFKQMKKDAVFINVGRGNLCSEKTLIEVLENNIIKAIGLDVTEKEPLDSQSKLWDYPNVFITPHAAGNFHIQKAHDDFVDLVEENLRRYINNQELLYVVEERE